MPGPASKPTSCLILAEQPLLKKDSKTKASDIKTVLFLKSPGIRTGAFSFVTGGIGLAYRMCATSCKLAGLAS